jgi:hypothetical protein
MPDRTPANNDENAPEPVNPADRGEESGAEGGTEGHEITNDRSRASSHSKQSEQNQDQNKNYDPSQGKRADQMRRNDKRGQMGG